MNMIKLLLAFFITISIGFGFDEPNQDILEAMKDEIERSLDSLQIDGLEEPYFIEYKYTELDAHSIRGQLGSIEASNNNKSAYLSVNVRVGDYKFDNSNFFDVGLGFFGSSDDEEGFKRRKVSYKPTYDYLRREFWLATDAAYKQSAELYSKKLAVLKNRLRNDTTPDFSMPREIISRKEIKKIPDFDYNYFEKLVKNTSSVFNDYGDIFTSGVSIEFIPKREYYVNSEGTEYIKDSYYTGFEIVAATQNNSGMPLFDHYITYSSDPNNLPSYDSLISASKKLAENIDKKLRKDQLDDFYVGPIIFNKQAAAELFIQSFLPKLIAQREPLTDGGFSSDNEDAVFQRKIGGRVLPKYMSIIDKPALEKYDSTDLIGHYNIDDDGNISEEVTLVKNGYLETLLTDRTPTKKIPNSNGHKRGGSVMYSNIVVNNDSTELNLNQLDLEKELIKSIERRELEYGIVIEKLLNQNIRYTSLYRITNGNIEIPFGKKNYVMEGYKLYKDGTKEAFSGMVVPSFNVLLFKDILFTSKEKFAYNFLANAVQSPYITGGDRYIPSSIIVPNLMFEDGELHIIEEDFKKPPYINSSLVK